jgi:hypothetical protein
MLVLLIEGICEVRRWDGFIWHDIYIPSFMKIIKVLLQKFERL